MTTTKKKPPKNPAVQRRIHKKPERKLIENSDGFSPVPADAVVLYFVGLSDERFIKFGIAQDIKHAYQRLSAHSKKVATEDKEYVFLTAAWAKKKDEDWLKSFWHNKMPIKSERELVLADSDVLGYIRYLRSLQHVAANEFSDLSRLSFVDFEQWCPGIGRFRHPQSGFAIYGIADGPFSDVRSIQYMPLNDYFTNPKLIEAVYEVFEGPPDVDPASCAPAQYGDRKHPGINAKQWFNQFQNGLKQEWHGKVFINPPFTEWELWAPKVAREFDSGRATEIIVYCTFQTSTTIQFGPIRSRASACLVTNGRIECWGPNVANNTNADGNFIAYLGHRPLAFSKAFAWAGDTWPRPKGWSVPTKRDYHTRHRKILLKRLKSF